MALFNRLMVSLPAIPVYADFVTMSNTWGEVMATEKMVRRSADSIEYTQDVQFKEPRHLQEWHEKLVMASARAQYRPHMQSMHADTVPMFTTMNTGATFQSQPSGQCIRT